MKKMTVWMKQEEKDKIVHDAILRSARQMHNACKQVYNENKCNGCPFNAQFGCKLYNQPITWDLK